MPATTPDPPQAGFTLIETLVALVILSAVLFAFYDFLGSALNGARGAERAATAYDLRQNALAVATMLNPMETPDGTFDIGLYRIRWHAERIGPVRQSSGFPTGKGRFAIALYHVVLDFPEERGFPGVEVTKLGYHLEGPAGAPAADAVN